MDLITQRVICFVADWCYLPSDKISEVTPFNDLGIISATGALTNIIMDLEDSFGLTYQPGDDKGMVTVGDAVALINRKLDGFN